MGPGSAASIYRYPVSCIFALIPRLVYALESMLYMLSQHRAIGLQTDYMVTVLAPMVEAARLPHVRPMALG